jgi:hypothetical protein
MSAVHSPGPWEVSTDKNIHGHTDLVVMTHGYFIATLHGIHGGVDEANAHLIAAAPDLFAACEAGLTRLERLAVDKPKTLFPRLHAEMDAMRAAIAKAKGGTP